MHHKKLIKSMHDNAWTEKEIDKGLKALKRAENKESKKILKFNYWSNIIFLFAINILSSIALTPIIVTTKLNLGLLFIAILGLVFGVILIPAIHILEDYYEKHHRIISNIIIIIISFIINYIVLRLMLFIVKSNKSIILYSIVYIIALSLPSIAAYIEYDIGMKRHKKK